MPIVGFFKIIIKMSMTPEEKFNGQVWEILQDIREEILATEKGSPVKYRIPKIVGGGSFGFRKRNCCCLGFF